MAINVLEVAFSDGRRSIISSPLYQYDYGQIIHINGLSLPQNFEAHFSNTDTSGNSITMLGTENYVEIPNELLETGSTIYCFIYLHDKTTDGETEYKIKVPIFKRPQRTIYEPTPEQTDLIAQVISQLGIDATRAEEAKNEAQTAAEEAEAAAEKAKKYAENITVEDDILIIGGDE